MRRSTGHVSNWNFQFVLLVRRVRLPAVIVARGICEVIHVLYTRGKRAKPKRIIGSANIKKVIYNSARAVPKFLLNPII
jgi:hypothetical protein